MLKIKLKYDDSSLKKPSELLQDKLGIQICDSGLEITVQKSDKLSVCYDGKKGSISYITKASFFRMLTQFVKNYKENKTFDYSESIEIETTGIMFDLSRNGIMTVEALSEYFRYMAMMGLNTAGLYLESGYRLDDYPYFGYMQGGYSKEELMAIDDAGYMFGIEVIPFTQTITHSEKYLRMVEAAPVRDTIRCMMPCADATYELIETIIKHLKSCFRTNKIHLGADEAFNVGRGDYFSQNRLKGAKMPDELFLEHMKRVIDIALKHGVEPQMWSSGLRYFKLEDAFAAYEPFGKVTFPVGTYEGDEKLINDFFEMLKERTSIYTTPTAFAGGIQTWYGFAPEYNFTFNNVNTFVPLVKQYGCDEMWGYIWMNDGTECDFFLALPALQAYAEHMYRKSVTMDNIRDMFEFISGTKLEALTDLSYFHNKKMTDTKLEEMDGINFLGKKLLWQDPMMGLFDAKLYANPMSEHYAQMKEKYTLYKKEDNTLFKKRYEFFEKLFDVMSVKCSVAEKLKGAYMQKDTAYLKKVSKELFPELREKVEDLRKTHREMWLDVCKPFGHEVLDIRYGGLVARLDTASQRIEDYLAGNIKNLPEFDEDRLENGVIYSAMYFGESSASNPTTGAI